MSLTPNQSSADHAHTHTHNIYNDIELTIRFSASLPDLHLSIPGSLYANTATLKQLIRSRIPPQYGTRRIRLIYAGKALVDDVPLQVALQGKSRVGGLGSKVPSRIGTPVAPYGLATGTTGKEAGDKGKSPVRESGAAPWENRIYIHCSIGDVELSASDLSDEVAIAQRGAEQSEQQGAVPLPTLPQHSSFGPANGVTTTTPAPRGFDRLHSAGFTSAEITSLRLQFLSIQAHTHTPDTMPSPNTLRNMEDQWLDNSSGAGSALDAAGGADGGAGGGMVADDDGQIGALDDMVWGTVMGFFWPIGCLMWGVREEGIWSQRRKMAVVVGVLLNASLGIIRFTG
ncbi:hypothetical protein PV10_01813 [Exophiala mesophila]|uniref:Ubiquitin-like domain-containing protein n=1 Tax=Exophiala mesophila TaxID=212818 RepID=A0A0D2AGS5_EXOME|nr:uncharacterized protein PV10_01813 [Exophiala mesophila]KIV98133.1 hypothetical protein PV10_01813 [Exophiala mesophila]